MSSSSGNEDTFKRDDPLGATKRSLKTTSKDGRDLSEKKLRRLEKNRLSARECRRRKREATENMEHEMNVLEGENIRLRLQLQVRKGDRKTVLYSFVSHDVYPKIRSALSQCLVVPYVYECRLERRLKIHSVTSKNE